MSLIIPDSTVNLYADVPISAGHQLVFSSVSAQNTYFLNKRLVTKAGCSYIRKTGRLRIEFNAARVQQCDYMSFTNTSFENVTFYARILDYEYVNNETTDVLYAIDYWQTYMFDAEFHACSILREHLTETDYQKVVSNPWRRDIPEMLTDEGLPVGKPFEKLYEETTQSSILPDVYVGERFRVPDNVYETDLNNRYIAFFVTSFDYNAIYNLDSSATTEFLSFWDSINGEATATLEDAFSSWDNGFARSFGIFAIKYDGNANWKEQMNKALNWFAIWGVTSAIIGMYVLPKYIMDGLGDNDGRLIHVSLNKLIDKDPKLNTYPFRYIRVISPLDTKEYRIDLFNSASNPSSTGFVEFRLVSNCNGLPTIAIVPVEYDYYIDNEYESGTLGYIKGLNFKERIEYSGFAQVGFSIDSYLTFLSGQYNDAIKSNTASGMAAARAAGISAISELTKPIVNAVGTALGGDYSQQWVNTGRMTYELQMPNAPSGFQSNTSVSGMANAAASLYKTDELFALQEEAQNRTGVSEIFRGTKYAYVADQYTAGSGGGLLAYQLYNIGFIFEIVTLNDDILQKYSDYLSIYGYKSLRTGRPHICDYVTDGSNTPHFTTFDGETFTYVQTENMHVTGLQANACAAIENLFNAGCRFLKGD